MADERFVADGLEQLQISEGYRTARAEVIAQVRARYAGPLASAGILRRISLRVRMRREIVRELAKLAPPDALYLHGR
jgi:hypothetical protein